MVHQDADLRLGRDVAQPLEIAAALGLLVDGDPQARAVECEHDGDQMRLAVAVDGGEPGAARSGDAFAHAGLVELHSNTVRRSVSATVPTGPASAARARAGRVATACCRPTASAPPRHAGLWQAAARRSHARRARAPWRPAHGAPRAPDRGTAHGDT